MVSREQKVTESVQEYVKAALTTAGVTSSKVAWLEAWDGSDLETPLEKNTIATGYGFDDGGKSAEVGSDLITRLYTIEFLIFALNATWGRNLASIIQTAIESNQGIIPLLDIGEAGQPEIDSLVLENVSAERQPTPANPPKWAQFVFTVHARLRDEYFATLTP